MKVFFCALITLLCYFPGEGLAQTFGSVNIARNGYIGELTPFSGSYLSPARELNSLHLSVGVQRYVGKNVWVSVQVGSGDLEGAYSFGDQLSPEVFDINPEVNTYFRTEYQSLTLGVGYEIIRTTLGHFYAEIGFGFLSYNVQDQEQRQLRLATSTRNPGENYQPLTTYFPFRLGVLLFREARANLIAEVSWNLTNTDYLDNIGELGGKGNDIIFRNVIGIRYRFLEKRDY